MKTKLMVMVLALFVSMSSTAHDPKEHAKTSEAPNCQALADMDHEKMDMDDPVMKAMLAKCKEAMPEHGDEHDKDKHDMDMKNTTSMKDDDHDDRHDEDHGPGDSDDPH